MFPSISGAQSKRRPVFIFVYCRFARGVLVGGAVTRNSGVNSFMITLPNWFLYCCCGSKLCFCSFLLFFSIDLIRYGDVTPKSVPGRVFGIIWVLVGAVVMSIFTATVINVMQTAVDGTKCKDIQGKEVSVDFRLTIIACSSRAMRINKYRKESLQITFVFVCRAKQRQW